MQWARRGFRHLEPSPSPSKVLLAQTPPPEAGPSMCSRNIWPAKDQGSGTPRTRNGTIAQARRETEPLKLQRVWETQEVWVRKGEEETLVQKWCKRKKRSGLGSDDEVPFHLQATGPSSVGWDSAGCCLFLFLPNSRGIWIRGSL